MHFLRNLTSGKLRYFLGMSVEQDEDSASVWISQPVYTENLFMKLWWIQDFKKRGGCIK